MATKNKQTFASRAKSIQKKYPRRETDKIEQQDFEEEMDSLISEQEQYRAANGMGQENSKQTQQFAGDNKSQFLPLSRSSEPIPSWNLPARGLEFLGEQYSQNAPDWLKTGVEGIGNVIDYIDTGGGVLKGSNNPYLNTGVAPVVGIAGKVGKIEQAFEPSIGRINRAYNASNATKEAKLLDELAAAPGSLGKQYPSGVTNSYDNAINAALVAKRTNELKSAGKITSGTPWDKIGYGALGTGIIGSAGYGLSNIDLNTTPNGVQTQITPSSSGKNSNIIEIPTGRKITPNAKVGNGSLASRNSGIAINNIAAKTNTNPSQSLAYDASDLDTKRITPISSASSSVIGGTPFFTNPTMLESGKLSQSTLNIKNKQLGSESSDNTSLTPSYIAAGAGILGNVLQSALARKPKQIQTPSYAPKELDLYDRVLQAKRAAEEASAASGVRSRNLGLNAGATIANQSATQSEIDKNLGNQLTDISVAEGQYNAGEANKAGMFNAENKLRADVLNEQMKQQFADKQLEGLTGALGVIPDAMQDINKIKAQDKMFKSLSTKEKNMLKLLSSGKYKYDPEMINILFNNK